MNLMKWEDLTPGQQEACRKDWPESIESLIQQECLWKFKFGHWVPYANNTKPIKIFKDQE